MTLAEVPTTARLPRRNTTPGVHPYDEITWERSDARIDDWKTGEASFEQADVEFPDFWSVSARNIVAQKYFRGHVGTDGREFSLKQVVDRIADSITKWGFVDGYFDNEDDAEVFNHELKWLMVNQRVAFNSPVWFNIGVPDVPQQASACFILDVDDEMDAILDWYKEEGVIFKGGSGAGVNLSKIRSSKELLQGGGTPSGPVSFMRGADASAGTIASGGKTRRAAKMVVLDVDHPDIEEFALCKAKEEKKIRALREAGFDMDVNGSDIHSASYQNANNSVRVTDEFMEAVDADRDWNLIARTTGETIKTVKARDLFEKIMQATWECADPGMQYDSVTNLWNVTPNTGRIDASNPCSEHVRLANSACNLASLNLLRFVAEGQDFDVDGFIHAAKVTVTAQDILVGNSDYPTEKITAMAKRSRDIGLGFANLGATLMAMGLPYDSDEGRSFASAITAVMTGAAAVQSTQIAERLGASDLYADNTEPWQNVYRMHRAELDKINFDAIQANLVQAAVDVWDEANARIVAHGARNAELSVLAPTGTIAFAMDCDTTGIEPDLGLVKFKKLVGGGNMQIVNQTVPRALRRLGYTDDQITEIAAYIKEKSSILGAPGLNPDHLPVFACAMGDNTIAPMGHVRMMAAAQPWISGAISKTVNVPEDTSVADLAEVHMEAWKLGIKAIAVYRDGCKTFQPMSTSDDSDDKATSAAEVVERIVEKVVTVNEPVRHKMPRSRRSQAFEFRVAECKGFVHVGEYEDGRPGEVFIKVSKQGSTLAGIMDAFAIAISHGLQYGVPLKSYVDAFVNMRFEPAGMTDDPDLRIAQSIIDYIFKRLAVDYLPVDERREMGIETIAERTQPTLPTIEEQTTESVQGHDIAPVPASSNGHAPAAVKNDAPLCFTCGVSMVRSGSCHACPSCGGTSGCS